MKFKFLITTILIMNLLSGCYFKDCQSKQTTNQKHLKKLLETNNCPGCYLGDANLSGANLNGANLLKAELVKAVLDGANLEKANLSQAQLSWHEIDVGWGTRNTCDVDFSASLKGANLSQADLSQANLRDVDLDNTFAK